ncbi:nicotinate-nucleotide adenylyltransferase [Pseudoxanthomonas sp. SGNA-20]|uniref:nicotinate-nucleotide adenylyltransferase n=1 Tax=Pseudoxanthomonas sp. SGNA-20 TaxID=2493088 RepID=UPI000F642B7F|nr:nicotinate-nucleotide adenylyltransferase [Pseudoxanthomonas sp. SGNA-20]RRN56569.1 nicotinate-nucleotide adenylyltransferase [Pseudoxanthomonas sp. SGNA-20]
MLRLWYGGTFDPVHCGHLAIARAAADAFGVPVTLAPAADPPHRAVPGASAHHRARMLDVAAAGDRRLRVDRRELERSGPSWTIDTLRELRVLHGGDAPLALLLGADSFRSLPQWHQWREILSLAHLVVASRGDEPVDRGLPPELAAATEGRWCDSPAALAAGAGGRILPLRQPLHPQSASAVRAAIAAGDPGWQGMVPPAVAGYILRHGLYGAGQGAHGVTGT